jgi:hypothetical protein
MIYETFGPLRSVEINKVTTNVIAWEGKDFMELPNFSA